MLYILFILLLFLGHFYHSHFFLLFMFSFYGGRAAIILQNKLESVEATYLICWSVKIEKFLSVFDKFFYIYYCIFVPSILFIAVF